MYGSEIDTYDLSNLKEAYKVEGTEYEKVSTLKKDEYRKIIECFSKSKSVKLKFKRVFENLINSI